MKVLLSLCVVLLAGCQAEVLLQSKPKDTPKPQPSDVAKTFHNCQFDGGTGNAKGYQTASEIYACDEGRIELEGRWSMTIEYGSVFRSQLGRQEGETFPASEGVLKTFKWCATPKPWDKNQKELCGLNPPDKCWDGKPPRFDKSGDWTCVDKTHSPKE